MSPPPTPSGSIAPPLGLGELRKRILKLNKAGYSACRISRETGIPDSSVRRCLKFLKKYSSNGVIDTTKGIREQGKWYKICLEVLEILKYYTAYKPSLRTVFYVVESKVLITKDEYNTFDGYMVMARLGVRHKITGELLMPKIPIDAFADESRQVLDDGTDKYNPRYRDDPNDYVNGLVEGVQDAIQELKDAAEDYETYGAGKRGDYWHGQSNYVEVWVESNALGPTLKHFLKDRHVLVVPNKGYTSLDYVNRNCKRIKEMCQHYKPENIHILYYGDKDPSGSQMFEYIKQTFKDLGVSSRVQLKWVAITDDQVRKYNLPKLPINHADPRAKKYNGTYAVELDAMIAYKPKAFEKLVQKSVDDLYDKKIYDKMVKDYETPPEDLQDIQDEIQDKIDDELKELHDDLDE